MVWGVNMWRRTVGGAVMVALVAASGAGAATRPSAADGAAAKRFVSVETRFLHRATSQRAAERAAGAAFLSRVSKGCAGAIPASVAKTATPAQGTVVASLAVEADFDLAAAVQHPLSPAVHAELSALRRLHFTRSAIDRDLASGIKAERAALAVKPTDLCADVKAAAAGDFDAVPAATRRFLNTVRKLASTDPILSGALLRMIRPDLPRRDRAAAVRLGRLDRSVGRAASRLVAAQHKRLFAVLMPGGPGDPFLPQG